MDALLERARAHLASLEADRQAAIALSEQKAEEAKLMKARQEGFQAAMEILCAEIPSCIVGPDRPVPKYRRTIRSHKAGSAQAPVDPTTDRAGIVVFRPRNDGSPDRQSH